MGRPKGSKNKVKTGQQAVSGVKVMGRRGRPKGSKNKQGVTGQKKVSLLKARRLAQPGEKARGRKSKAESSVVLWSGAGYVIAREPLNFTLTRKGTQRVSYFSSLSGVFTALMNETVGDSNNADITTLVKAVDSFQKSLPEIVKAIDAKVVEVIG